MSLAHQMYTMAPVSPSQQDLAKLGKWPKQVVLFPQEVMPPNYLGLSRSQQPLGGRQKRAGLVLGNV